MKHRTKLGFLIALAVGVVLSSCSKGSDDYTPEPIVESNQVIGFATTTGSISNSRGPVGPSTNLNGKSIYVFGVEHQGTANWNTGTNGLMARLNPASGTLATSTNLAGTYKVDYTPKAFYAANAGYLYDFMAVYPGASTPGMTLVPATATAPPMLDIDIEQQPDLMIAKITNATKSTTNVNMGRLKHKLSQVSLNIYKKAGLQQTIYIHQLYTYGNARGRYNPVAETWSNKVVDSTVVLKFIGDPHTYKTVKEKANAEKLVEYLVLPCAPGEYYVFDVWLNQRKASIRIPTVATDQLEAGKKYVYDVEVQGSDIYLEVNPSQVIEEEQWEDVDDDIII